MPYGENRSQSPKVLSLKTLLTALVVHLAFFLLLWAYSVVNFKDKEVVIPIDLTVVVNENLDGKKDEPPPLDDTPPPPPPKSVLPKTPPKAEPPPKVDEKVDALVKVKEPKKNEVKKPDKKRTKKSLIRRKSLKSQKKLPQSFALSA
jgi:outer membrane biosynthesis protein TonB